MIPETVAVVVGAMTTGFALAAGVGVVAGVGTVCVTAVVGTGAVGVTTGVGLGSIIGAFKANSLNGSRSAIGPLITGGAPDATG